ncbi:hypothetical protein IW262DRAFT_1233436, partial [Armillaria fumosa]
NADGKSGDTSDVHYKCCHGKHCKIITITKSMHGNLSTLITHLKSNFPAMYQLWSVLHSQTSPPMQEEINVANGTTSSEFIQKLKKALSNIEMAFACQSAEAAVRPWEQEKFEKLLTEWIVACNQPFEEVE